jgi:hypothetical protein
MATRLELLAEKFRNESIARNSYQSNAQYDSNHPNAMSDGDEKGKGESSNSIGSSVDIQKRNESLMISLSQKRLFLLMPKFVTLNTCIC